MVGWFCFGHVKGVGRSCVNNDCQPSEKKPVKHFAIPRILQGKEDSKSGIIHVQENEARHRPIRRRGLLSHVITKRCIAHWVVIPLVTSRFDWLHGLKEGSCWWVGFVILSDFCDQGWMCETRVITARASSSASPSSLSIGDRFTSVSCGFYLYSEYRRAALVRVSIRYAVG